MNREQAETLLAALIADEMDEPVRGELLAYLKSDPVLSERLGDMRLAAGLLREGFEAASADAPAALDASPRAELLALFEREPISAVVAGSAGSGAAGNSSAKRLGPLFSIRMASAVAACAALGIGLIGMLPELGAARRTARRMQTPMDEAADYAYEAPAASIHGSDLAGVIPGPLLGDIPTTGGLYSTRRNEVGDGIDVTGGTRIDAAKVDPAGQYIAESAGKLALGDDVSGYVSKYNFRGYEQGESGMPVPRSPQSAPTQPNAPTFGPTADTGLGGRERIADDPLARIDRYGDPSQPLDARVELERLEREVPGRPGEKLDQSTFIGGQQQAGDIISGKVTGPAADPAEMPPAEFGITLNSPASKNGLLGLELPGSEGLSRESNEEAPAPTTTLKGAEDKIADWSGSTVWNDNHTEFGRGNSDDGRTTAGLPDSKGKTGQDSNGWKYDREKRGLIFDGTADKTRSATASEVDTRGYEQNQQQRGEQIQQQLSQLTKQQNELSDLSTRQLEDRPGLSKDNLRNREDHGKSGQQTYRYMADKDASVSDQYGQDHANAAGLNPAEPDPAAGDGPLFGSVPSFDEVTLIDPGNKQNQTNPAKADEQLHDDQKPLILGDRSGVDRIAGVNAPGASALDSPTATAKPQVTQPLSGISKLEEERRAAEGRVLNGAEQRKIEEVQERLGRARELQREMKFEESVKELDAALFIDPDNAAVNGLRDMFKGSSTGVENFEWNRIHDLGDAEQSLKNIEATTPYDDILVYPGQWPELTEMRLRGVTGDADGDKTSGNPSVVATPKPTPEPEPEPETIVDNAKQTRVAPPVNPWVLTELDAQSTFALDTDTASYELTRRTIREQAQLPPVASVRMEEFVNRFDYQYPTGRDVHDTFTVHPDAGPSPFAGSAGGEAVLLKVGVRGRVVARDQMKPAHYVFVIDASGSMAREDRLPLVRQSLAMLLGQLGQSDTVSLVSYETKPYLLLEHAPASDAQAIMKAAETIQTGGSTNLSDGLKLGYQVAGKHFQVGGVNRVILCSDGVANVGDDDAAQMLESVSKYRQHGITMMTVGVGVDGQTAGQATISAERFNDGLMEQLANRGDGQYVYLGSAEDAQRQFVEDLAATRPTIAYDAKIQVQFDKSVVRRYRLIGYENRAIADRDFRNDAVDAGEVGSGQSATALYEIELWPTRGNRAGISNPGNEPSLGTVYVRYRDAQSNAIEETTTLLPVGLVRERTVAEDPRFYLAACAAEFAELLRESEHAADGSYDRLLQIAREVSQALPLDRDAGELVELIGRAKGLPRAGQ